mgnify:CR=1 FL=1
MLFESFLQSDYLKKRIGYDSEVDLIPFSIDPENNLLYASSRRQLDIDDFASHILEIMKHPKFTQQNAYYNFYNVESVTGDPDRLKVVASRLQQCRDLESGPAKVAIYCSPNSVLQKALRSYVLSAEGSVLWYKFFHDKFEALGWLHS